MHRFNALHCYHLITIACFRMLKRKKPLGMTREGPIVSAKIATQFQSPFNKKAEDEADNGKRKRKKQKENQVRQSAR